MRMRPRLARRLARPFLHRKPPCDASSDGAFVAPFFAALAAGGLPAACGRRRQRPRPPRHGGPGRLPAHPAAHLPPAARRETPGFVPVRGQGGAGGQHRELLRLHARSTRAWRRWTASTARAGLVVLGFPSNDFSQETGTNKEIAEFCESTFGVKFPMFAKSSVRGAGGQSAVQGAGAGLGHHAQVELLQVPDRPRRQGGGVLFEHDLAGRPRPSCGDLEKQLGRAAEARIWPTRRVGPFTNAYHCAAGTGSRGLGSYRSRAAKIARPFFMLRGLPGA